MFLGLELGARSKDPSCYEDGRVQYRRLAETELFKNGLARIIKGAISNQIALLCAEKEPLNCHRTLLVARELETQGVNIVHIHPDGRLETQKEAMNRLMAMFGLEKLDMFRTEEEALQEACTRQEQRIAYVDEDWNEAEEMVL